MSAVIGGGTKILDCPSLFGRDLGVPQLSPEVVIVDKTDMARGPSGGRQ